MVRTQIEKSINIFKFLLLLKPLNLRDKKISNINLP